MEKGKGELARRSEMGARGGGRGKELNEGIRENRIGGIGENIMETEGTEWRGRERGG